jgi:TetR/AcrR family transcriptional regulator
VSRANRERDAEVAREAILEAAEEVFAREGFDGARIDSIALESGYNKSLLFHYFEDKDGLYRAVVEKMKRQLHLEFIQPLVYFIQSSKELSANRLRLFLELAINRYFDFLTQHANSLHIMAWEAAERWRTFIGLDFGQHLNEYKEAMTILANFLQEAKDAGFVNRNLDPLCLIVNLGNMCVMYLLSAPRYQKAFGEQFSLTSERLDFARQQITDLITHGILTSS